jgi:TolB-like protein
MKGLFDELRRRNVLRALAIYTGAAWLLVQVATQVFPFFDVPNWAVRWIIVASLLGLPVAALLAWFYEFTPQGLKLESELDPNDARLATRGMRLGRSGVVILAVGAMLLLSDYLLRRFPLIGAPQPLAMAVMPFKNLSGDQDQAYFSDGIQDEIQTRLSKIAEFKVISRTSARYYAAQLSDPRRIAEQLGVSHLVEGSVQRHGNSARINVQLIAADSDTQLWGETYDRQLTNVFDVESEVAKAIVDALQARLSPTEKRELAADPTHNAQAYDAYLRGLAAHARSLEAGQLADAARWFGKAVELDPQYALAWARLARVNADRAYYGIDLVEHPCDQARHAAETAWRLKPDQGETDLARGFVRFMCDNDPVGAEHAFEDARLRLPNNADVLRAISQIEWQRSNWPAVLQYLSDAAELDPRNPELLSTYSLYLGANRRFGEARAMALRALQVTPDDAMLRATAALIDQADGQLDAAQSHLAGLPLQPEVVDVFGYQMLQRLYRGEHQQARRELESAMAGDLSALGVGVADYYSLLASAQLAGGDGASARQTFVKGYQLLKAFDNGSITDNSSAGVYLRSLLCLNAVGADAAALSGSDCKDTRRIADSGNQFALTALETLAYADVLAGNRDAALAAIARLLERPYLSARYHTPLTPALLRQDPIWSPLRDDPRLHKLLAKHRAAVQ